MLIGIKYCGGCNPFYDRKAEVEKLKERMEGACFEPVRHGRDYDKILLVCGCGRACIRKYSISGKDTTSEKDIASEKHAVSEKYYLVKSREDFIEIQKLLEQ